MKLDKKKALACKVLGVGKEKIMFHPDRLEEIKEIITKQDVRDLVEQGAIIVKEPKGRRKVQRRKRRRAGKIKKRVKNSKKEYVTITRKLRAYIAEAKESGKIEKEKYNDIRKRIKAREFKNKIQLKEHMSLK